MKKGELELIDYAIYFATKAHTGQKRKSEKNVDMIFHPFTVGMILQRAGANTNCVIAGLLHDVVEDSKYSLADIEIEFGKDISKIVEEVSEDKSLPWKERKIKAIDKIKTASAVLLKQMFNSEFMKKYKPLTYGFVTSPELSVHRKGKEGRLVNRKNVKLFNECMEAEKEVIKEGAKKYTTIETDPYQGNIKQFIMDLVETITEDVRENIRENIEIREQKTIDDL